MENIEVSIRLRPLNKVEQNKKEQSIWEIDEKQTTIQIKEGIDFELLRKKQKLEKLMKNNEDDYRLQCQRLSYQPSTMKQVNQQMFKIDQKSQVIQRERSKESRNGRQSTFMERTCSLSSMKSQNSYLKNDESRCSPISRTQNSYNFDVCFNEETSNKQIYDTNVEKIVKTSLSGINGTIFVYGQTGSGKTFTILGNEKKKLSNQKQSQEENNHTVNQEQGILIYALQDILRKSQEDEDRSYQIKCSYIEIYNEIVYDLLKEQVSVREPLYVHEDLSNQNFYIKGLEELEIQSIDDALRVIRFGELNRQYAQTNLNHASSRSHVIFKIQIQSIPNNVLHRKQDSNSQILQAELNFIDLAGSEKIDSHYKEKFENDSSINKGKTPRDSSNSSIGRSKEGNNINKSLFFLTQVITQKSKLQKSLRNSTSQLFSISKEQTYISYRNSVLTKILKKSLEGNSRISLVICLTPTISQYSLALTSLRFGQNARNIQLHVRENSVSANKKQMLDFQNIFNNKKKSEGGFVGHSSTQNASKERKQSKFDKIMQLEKENSDLKDILSKIIAKFKQYQSVCKCQGKAPITQNSSFNNDYENQLQILQSQSETLKMQVHQLQKEQKERLMIFQNKQSIQQQEIERLSQKEQFYENFDVNYIQSIKDDWLFVLEGKFQEIAVKMREEKIKRAIQKKIEYFENQLLSQKSSDNLQLKEVQAIRKDINTLKEQQRNISYFCKNDESKFNESCSSLKNMICKNTFENQVPLSINDQEFQSSSSSEISLYMTKELREQMQNQLLQQFSSVASSNSNSYLQSKGKINMKSQSDSNVSQQEYLTLESIQNLTAGTIHDRNNGQQPHHQRKTSQFGRRNSDCPIQQQHQEIIEEQQQSQSESQIPFFKDWGTGSVMLRKKLSQADAQNNEKEIIESRISNNSSVESKKSMVLNKLDSKIKKSSPDESKKLSEKNVISSPPQFFEMISEDSMPISHRESLDPSQFFNFDLFETQKNQTTYNRQNQQSYLSGMNEIDENEYVSFKKDTNNTFRFEVEDRQTLRQTQEGNNRLSEYLEESDESLGKIQKEQKFIEQEDIISVDFKKTNLPQKTTDLVVRSSRNGINPCKSSKNESQQEQNIQTTKSRNQGTLKENMTQQPDSINNNNPKIKRAYTYKLQKNTKEIQISPNTSTIYPQLNKTPTTKSKINELKTQIEKGQLNAKPQKNIFSNARNNQIDNKLLQPLFLQKTVSTGNIQLQSNNALLSTRSSRYAYKP